MATPGSSSHLALQSPETKAQSILIKDVTPQPSEGVVALMWQGSSIAQKVTQGQQAILVQEKEAVSLDCTYESVLQVIVYSGTMAQQWGDDFPFLSGLLQPAKCHRRSLLIEFLESKEFCQPCHLSFTAGGLCSLRGVLEGAKFQDFPCCIHLTYRPKQGIVITDRRCPRLWQHRC
ncbi:hypothetical protein QTO34_019490, partial [Cnephaeus nilssonii]